MLLPEGFYLNSSQDLYMKSPQICRISVIFGKKSTGIFPGSRCRGDGESRAAAGVCGSPASGYRRIQAWNRHRYLTKSLKDAF